MSLLPVQAPPVRRPAIIEPHRVVEVEHGSAQQLLRVRLLLLHGANFNDPAPFAFASISRMLVSGGSWGGA